MLGAVFHFVFHVFRISGDETVFHSMVPILFRNCPSLSGPQKLQRTGKSANTQKRSTMRSEINADLRSKWSFTECETGQTKVPGKWESKWKMAPGLTWTKQGCRNGKMAKNLDKITLWPFSRDFCIGPVSHSLNGHFDRKNPTDNFCSRI